MPEIFPLEKDNDLSAFLEPYIQSGNLSFILGSGASFPAIKTAGNIEMEINDLLAREKLHEANRRSLDFIENIDHVHKSLVDGNPSKTTHDVTSSYQTFISIVDRILFERKNILIPRQANIFTTNYDVFVEYAASLCPSVILNDGFDRTVGFAGEFVFSPERYFDRTYRAGALYGHQTEMPTINLIKLHGSLSWRRREDTVTFSATSTETLPDADKKNPAKVREFLEKRFLILPNLRKFNATLMERVYYDLLRIFSKAMDRENAVLLSFGFSYADEHILDITRRALRNPTSHLVIFSYDHASVASFRSKFSKQRNVTIVSPGAADRIDFIRLNKILTAVLAENVDE